MAAITPTISPVPAADSSNVKYSSPPISSCSGEPLALLRNDALELVEVAGVDRLDRRVLHPDECHPPVGGHRLARAEHVGQAGQRRPTVGQRGPRGGRPGEGRAVVDRRRHHLRRQSAAVGPGRLQQVHGRLRVQPRHLERVLHLAAEVRGREDHEQDDNQPGAYHGPWTTGGEPAQPVERIRHCVLLGIVCASVQYRLGPMLFRACARAGSAAEARLPYVCGARRLSYSRPISRAGDAPTLKAC